MKQVWNIPREGPLFRLCTPTFSPPPTLIQHQLRVNCPSAGLYSPSSSSSCGSETRFSPVSRSNAAVWPPRICDPGGDTCWREIPFPVRGSGAWCRGSVFSWWVLREASWTTGYLRGKQIIIINKTSQKQETGRLSPRELNKSIKKSIMCYFCKIVCSLRFH